MTISLRDRDEAGLTLVELIVAIVISGLFLGLLALMFINGLTTQERSVARDTATGRADVIRATVHSGVRNATAIRVSDDGLRLDAVVVTDAGVLECQAWQLDGTDLYFSRGSGALPSDLTGANPIVTGVTGLLADDAAFEQTSPLRVSLGLRVAVGDVVVDTTDGVAAQAVVDGGGLTCWTS